MLEKLSDVAWAELSHAYGSAADVPDQIRALRADDADERKKARWHLYGNIFHQGSRYQATAYAVPFLLELLADPATPERSRILELLTALAIGYDESWLPGPFPIAGYRVQAAGGDRIPIGTGDLDHLGDDDQERLLAHLELRAYDAVRAGVPLFCSLLSDDDPRVRTTAAYALAWFGEETATSTGPLVAAAADPEPAVAATALIALALSGSATPGPLSPPAAGSGPAPASTTAGRDVVLVRALHDDRDVVRWGAAVALARLHGPAADPAVATELLTWAASGGSPRRDIPYLGGDTSGHAALALRQLGDAHAETAFDALLARIPAVNGPEALPVVGEALRRAFPDGRVASGARFTDLDDHQQRLLRALAGSPATWQWGEFGQFANFMSMVHAFGLPQTADAMRAFVSDS